MLKNDAVLIFDLDETILSVNSFPYWVKSFLFAPFGGLSFQETMQLRLKATQALLERKLMGRSHIDTKRELQALWKAALAKDPGQRALRHICDILQSYVRLNMQSILSCLQRGECDAILATSAAGEYAEALGRQLGFTHIITTGEVENCREQKRDNVIAMLAALGWNDRKRLFFTDHIEDMPMIREAQVVFWFDDEDGARHIRQEAPQVKLHMCAHLTNAELMQLISV